jgi:hypothetical protein
MHLLEPPTSLFRPSLVWRILTTRPRAPMPTPPVNVAADAHDEVATARR